LINKLKYRNLIFIIGSVLGLILLIIVLYNFREQIINQFTRSSKKIDLSSRGEIWLMHINYFLENPLFGNGSYKYFVFHVNMSHAHNSFLQFLSTNGIIISYFYVLIFVFGINKHNYKVILPIMFVAFFQYILFWGISNEDIFLYMFLFNSKILNLKNETLLIKNNH